MSHITAIAAGVLSVLGLSRLAVAAAPSGDLAITLPSALPRPASTMVPSFEAALDVHLTCRDGAWGGTAWIRTTAASAVAQDGEHNVRPPARRAEAYHKARAVTTANRAAGLSVTVDATIDDVGDARGGRCQYSVQLKQAGDDIAGTFTGEFAGHKTTGAASARWTAPWPTTLPAHTPIAPGEHPRLLFRKSDIALLKERAKTPEGQAMVVQLRKMLGQDKEGFAYPWKGIEPAFEYCEGYWAAGHGLMYLLDNDADHLVRAQVEVRLGMTNLAPEFGNWGEAQHIAGIALAYDISGEYWDPALRAQVVRYLQRATAGKPGPGDSYYHAMFNAAAGLAALAILGDPPIPEAEATRPEKARMIAPAKDVTAGNGVPANAYASGHTPASWLYAGPFAPRADDDPLVPLGGAPAARPKAGDAVTYGKLASTFQPLPVTDTPQGKVIKLHPLSQKYRGFHWRPTLPQTPAAGQDFRAWNAITDKLAPTYWWFYTVIDNDQPRTVQLKLENTWTPIGMTAWLAGQPVADGEVVRMEKGLYPLMIRVPMGKGITRGSEPIAPQLIGYGLSEFEREQAARTARRAASAQAAGSIELAQLRLRRLLDIGIGDHGARGEFAGYPEAMDFIACFAAAARNTLGRDLAAGTGLQWVAASAMCSRQQVWRFSDGGVSCDWLPLGIGMARPEHLPALRWAVEHGLLDPNHTTTRPAFSLGISRPHHAIMLLCQYPFDIPARPPEKVLPLVLEDKYMGSVVLRSGWDESKDFMVSISGMSRGTAAPISAGDYTVFGLGLGGRVFERWTGMGPRPYGVMWLPRLDAGQSIASTLGGGLAGSTEAPNVVRIAGALPASGARVTHFEPQADGSGVVTLQFDSFVAGRCWQDWAECFTWDQVITDPANLGIKVLRSIAVDYSGKSGAPALLVVVDRITGAQGREAWVQTNLGRQSMVTLDGASFASRLSQKADDPAPLRQMRGTFVAPAGVQLKLLPAGTKITGGGVLHARGGDAYFMVATIGAGDAPAMKVDGSGLDAKVTIGQRKVWFDGQKVVLGE